MHTAPSKWTVVAAFILAVALHVGPVAWIEMEPAKPTLEADAPVLIHSTENSDMNIDDGTATARTADANVAAE